MIGWRFATEGGLFVGSLGPESNVKSWMRTLGRKTPHFWAEGRKPFEHLLGAGLAPD